LDGLITLKVFFS